MSVPTPTTKSPPHKSAPATGAATAVELGPVGANAAATAPAAGEAVALVHAPAGLGGVVIDHFERKQQLDKKQLDEFLSLVQKPLTQLSSADKNTLCRYLKIIAFDETIKDEIFPPFTEALFSHGVPFNFVQHEYFNPNTSAVALVMQRITKRARAIATFEAISTPASSEIKGANLLLRLFKLSSKLLGMELAGYAIGTRREYNSGYETTKIVLKFDADYQGRTNGLFLCSTGLMKYLLQRISLIVFLDSKGVVNESEYLSLIARDTYWCDYVELLDRETERRFVSLQINPHYLALSQGIEYYCCHSNEFQGFQNKHGCIASSMLEFPFKKVRCDTCKTNVEHWQPWDDLRLLHKSTHSVPGHPSVKAGGLQLPTLLSKPSSPGDIIWKFSNENWLSASLNYLFNCFHPFNRNIIWYEFRNDELNSELISGDEAKVIMDSVATIDKTFGVMSAKLLAAQPASQDNKLKSEKFSVRLEVTKVLDLLNLRSILFWFSPNNPIDTNELILKFPMVKRKKMVGREEGNDFLSFLPEVHRLERCLSLLKHLELFGLDQAKALEIIGKFKFRELGEAERKFYHDISNLSHLNLTYDYFCKLVDSANALRNELSSKFSRNFRLQDYVDNQDLHFSLAESCYRIAFRNPCSEAACLAYFLFNEIVRIYPQNAYVSLSKYYAAILALIFFDEIAQENVRIFKGEPLDCYSAQRCFYEKAFQLLCESGAHGVKKLNKLFKKWLPSDVIKQIKFPQELSGLESWFNLMTVLIFSAHKKHAEEISPEKDFLKECVLEVFADEDEVNSLNSKSDKDLPSAAPGAEAKVKKDAPVAEAGATAAATGAALVPCAANAVAAVTAATPITPATAATDAKSAGDNARKESTPGGTNALVAVPAAQNPTKDPKPSGDAPYVKLIIFNNNRYNKLLKSDPPPIPFPVSRLKPHSS